MRYRCTFNKTIFGFMIIGFFLPAVAFGQLCVDAEGINITTPTTLDFGNVTEGFSTTGTFNIRNGSEGQPMNVFEILSDDPQFTIVSSTQFCLAQDGGQQDVTVRFTPTKIGLSVSTIHIDTTGGQSAVQVSGTGLEGPKPDILVNPLQIDFGKVQRGTFKGLPLDIVNQGSAVLRVDALETDPCLRTNLPPPYVIQPTRRIKISFGYIPCVLGLQSKTIEIKSNDPDEARIPITLNAEGIPGPLGFVDLTKSSGLDKIKIDATASQWVDINNDGFQDLIINGTNGNAVLKNDGKGKFINVTKKSKLGKTGELIRGASWADVDNDGDLDVFLLEEGGSNLYVNKKGVFSKAANAFGAGMVSLNQEELSGGIWLDFNKDKLIDLFVVKDGQSNSLFRSNGALEFQDVAVSAGVDFNGPGRAAVAADFNGDGFDDLYVVNSEQQNRLYLNKKDGTFQDASASSGADQSAPGRQAVATDIDRDGDIDLFVANETGPSRMLKNNGNGKFQDATGPSRLASAKDASAAAFNDYDSDGDDDLIVLRRNSAILVFQNTGKGKFKKVNNIDLQNAKDPVTISTGDFDGDGDPDLFIGDGNQSDGNSNTLYENSGEGNHHLTIVLEGTQSNRAGIGAKVLVRVGLVFQAKVVSGGTGQNQESLPLEFGIGKATRVDSVQIVWPSGITQTLPNIAADQILKVVEQAQ